jgi:hypothetical protein
MAAKTWTLTDVDRDVYVDQFDVDPGEFGSTATFHVRKRTLRGGLRDGVDVVEIGNGVCRFAIVPTRGMGLWKGWLGEMPVGWNSPVRGPVHPAHVPLSEASGLGWLGGFDELLVRCGLASNGAPEFDENHNLVHPLHGRIANLPAHKIEVTVDGDSGAITVTGEVDECRVHFQKLRLTTTYHLAPGAKGIQIRDRVTNLSAEPSEMQLLYHINFGPPLLDAGAKLVAPVKHLVPRNAHAAQDVGNWDSYAAGHPGYVEQVYLFELAAGEGGRTSVLLKNAHGTAAAGLHFNTRQLPCFSQWKNSVSEQDGYVTGLEPGTNFPNPRAYESQHLRVVKLSPGGTAEFDIDLALYDQVDQIAEAQQAIARIQEQAEPQIHDRPQRGWTADVAEG